MPDEPAEKEPDAGPLVKVLGILADIEHIIRYLLSGAAICALWLASRSDWKEQLKRASDKPSVAATIIITVGFACYTLYRAAWWTTCDPIAYLLGRSAVAVPSNPKDAATEPKAFVDGYASFLFWRYSGAISDNLSRYLLYRWAVCHFGVLTGLAGMLSVFLAQQYSLIRDHWLLAVLAALFCLGGGLGQAYWLYQFEREMRCKRPSPQENAVVTVASGSVVNPCAAAPTKDIPAEQGVS